MKKITSFLVLISLLLSIVACSQKENLEQFSETTFNVGFNTPFTLIAYCNSIEDFEVLFKEMKDEVWYMHQVFDIYNTYDNINNIKTINDNAGIKPVVVDKIIIDLLIEADKYTKQTDSMFNPTLGPVLKIWHNAREKGILANQENQAGISPSIDELLAANEFVGWDFVEIDKENSTVYLNNKNAALDVGAIAKGYAVEMAAQSLEAKGVTNGVVNGGGNVRTIGSKLEDKPWVIGVNNPDSKDHSSVLSLAFDTSMSVVTSGDYERYFIDEQGRKQHHLIDSETLMPTNLVRSITVTTKDSTIADVLSTAFSMMPLDKAKVFSDSLNLDDLGLVWIFDDLQENTNYNYLVIDDLYVYYNDVIKNHIFEKK